MLIGIATLTILFVTLYWVLTHQTLYFGRVIVEVAPATMVAIYLLLLSGLLLRGKLRFLRPFLVAVALYLIADVTLFNLQMYYPVTLNRIYLLALIISIAVAVSDLPKRHLTSFAGFMGAAVSAYMLIYPYSGFAAVVVLAVLAYLGLTALASGFEGAVARGIASSRAYVLLSLAAVAIIEFAKPYLKGGLLDFAEWAVLALAAFAAFRNFKPGYDDTYLEEHSQRISRRFDELVVNLENAAKEFVNFGEKSMLVACLAKTLLDSGHSEREVAEVIRPIVNHCDERVSIFSFPWEKAIVERRNRSRREKILKVITERLRKGGEK